MQFSPSDIAKFDQTMAATEEQLQIFVDMYKNAHTSAVDPEHLRLML